MTRNQNIDTLTCPVTVTERLLESLVTIKFTLCKVIFGQYSCPVT